MVCVRQQMQAPEPIHAADMSTGLKQLQSTTLKLGISLFLLSISLYGTVGSMEGFEHTLTEQDRFPINQL